jgi:hypothetical protein
VKYTEWNVADTKNTAKLIAEARVKPERARRMSIRMVGSIGRGVWLG